MNSLEYIFFCNFLNFSFILFLSTFAFFSKNFSNRLTRFIKICIALIFLLTVSDAIKTYYIFQPEFHYARLFASTMGYIIRPICAGMMFLMCSKYTNRNLIIAHVIMILNMVIVIFNLWFPVVCYYDSDNSFYRASFWFIPYITSFSFLIAILISAVMNYKLNRRKAVFSFALCIAVTLGTLFESFEMAQFTLPTSGIICTFFFYLYMNTELYKRDTLTKIYKRETFEQDIYKYRKKKLVIATMDLNDLKLLNDSFGHAEGDRALITSVEGMKLFFEKTGILYRTGGDEFMAIFPKKTITEIEKDVQAFRNYMNSTKYRVAFGAAEYNKGDNIQEVMKLSDQRMYEDKKLLKSTPGLEL